LWWKVLRVINHDVGAFRERRDPLEKDNALTRHPRTIQPQFIQSVFIYKFSRPSREIRQQLLSRPLDLRLICFVTEDLKDPSLCRDIRYIRLKEVSQFEPRLRTVHNLALPNQFEPGGRVKLDQLFVRDQRNPIVLSVRPSPDVLLQKGGPEFFSLVASVDANGVNADCFPVWIVGRHGLMC